MKTDKGIYGVATMTQPEVGQTINDPVFNTPIKRITDASKIRDNAWGDGRMVANCQIEYSSVSPFNIHATLLLLMHGSYFVVYSGDGAFMFEPLVNGRYMIDASSEPRWSQMDPDFFYFFKGNEIWVYDITDRTATRIYTFPEYIQYTNKGVKGVRMMGEQDIPPDSKICLCGQRPDGAYELFMFNLLSLRKGQVSQPFATQSFDNLYSIEGLATVGFYGVGEGPENGEWLYESNMVPTIQLAGSTSHKDIGWDGTGASCLIWSDGNNPAESGGQICKPAGVVKILLRDGSKTCILPWPSWWNAYHTFIPYGVHGQCLISNYTPDLTKPTELWTNEIFILSMDGTQTVERLCHHRSIGNGTPFSYTRSPRASGSRSLERIVFNSGWGKEPDSYVDVYMIERKPVVIAPPVVTIPSNEPDPAQWERINFGMPGAEWLLRAEDGKLVMYNKKDINKRTT